MTKKPLKSSVSSAIGRVSGVLKIPRTKNPLAFAVDRKAGKVRATLTPPHVEIEIKPGKWIRWSRRNFPTVFAATKYARGLLKKHRVLANYGVRVVGGR